MVLHNPNNWHWVNKDALPWAKTYLEENLIGLSAEEGDVSARISKVQSIDGDVDVSQRKGKVITLFDVKLQLEYEGTFQRISILRLEAEGSAGKTKEAEEANGSITIPEVAHDTEEDEYVVCSHFASHPSSATPS